MTTVLTTQQIAAQAQKILEDEFDRFQANRVFSLVEITLKDGAVLGPIMLEWKPRDIDRVAEVVRDGYKMITLCNDTESLLILAEDIKYIKTLRVTSKEK